MLLWDRSCIVHETFSERKLIDLKLEHSEAKIRAHPECEKIILNRADFIGSTSKLLNFVQEDSADEFIVATESGILHEMKKLVPGKTLLPHPPRKLSCNECPYMKLNTMEELYLSMKNKAPEITLDPADQRALDPIERLLEMS